jgi:hypothetical protein
MHTSTVLHNNSGLYLCLFSDGTLKVGRASNVKTRLRSIESAGNCFDIFVVKKTHVFCRDHVKAEKKLIDWCISVCSKQSCREWFKGVNYNECLSMAQSIADGHMDDPVTRNIEKVKKLLDRLHPRTFTDEIYLASKDKFEESFLANRRVISALDFLHWHSEKIRSALGSGINPPEWFLDLNCDNPWEVKLWICGDYIADFPPLVRECADAIEEIQKVSI